MERDRGSDAAALHAEQRRRMEGEAADRRQAASEVADRRRALDDTERAVDKAAGLDHDRVRETRQLLADGGEKAVEKKFGRDGAASKEAAKARTQRESVRRHEREARERGIAAQEAKTAKERQRTDPSRTPLRDAAIEKGRARERDRSREGASLGR